MMTSWHEHMRKLGDDDYLTASPIMYCKKKKGVAQWATMLHITLAVYSQKNHFLYI